MEKALKKYDVIIGLEVHAQLATDAKAWCNCEISTHAMENTKVCEVCSGHPGTLPALNKRAVEFATKMALATNCKVNELSFFDRKNYFYPDLPKGYQITQFEVPLAQDGHIAIADVAGNEKKIRIERIQIEEDTGKSTHEGESSLINLNRAGTPLIEIVGRPDIRSPHEASAYLKKLHSVLTYLGVCHGNLQEGNFRCDVNVSIHPKGSDKWGTRTETKNLNSCRNVEKAIENEIARQADILDRGDKVLQQTLGFDAETLKVTVLRTKSDAHDYRYFPEPDLIPLVVTEAEKTKWNNELPELPEAKVARFVSEYSIPLYDADVLTTDKNLANYFEEVARAHKGEAKKASNWIMVELLRLLNEFNIGVDKSPVAALELASLLNAVHEGRISGKQAKDVFQKMFDEKKGADAVIEELGLVQISDTSALEEVAKKIIEANPTQVEQYLSGKDRVFGFFVGLMMKETKGQANPQIANDIMKKILDSKKA
ncbi:MAG: Asp-tRNA(Asn)/Glu-tRNA(Gln) amidotransferase subunit GatB [Bacteriovorax sp.]